MYLGIDLGTSSVKVVLINDAGEVLQTASSPLEVYRPHPLWSEQEPREWWLATLKALSALKAKRPFDGLRAIGLSGQMHGATLIDEGGMPLRPAILWNDGRSEEQCLRLERLVPESRQITGNRIMPGFTAPKLLWVAENEPAIFSSIRKVLLPKDFLRYRLTGELASDMSDASGTMWLDVGARDYSDALLTACKLDRSHMPELYEGPEVTGQLSADWAAYFGCSKVPVVAGAGDNAAGALGAGITEPGQAMMSLGTSGTYFVVADAFRQNSGRAVHSFCHALPSKWHVMSVILSAASCLTWLCRATGAESVERLLAEAEQLGRPHDRLFFLPYLAGERTPHNNPQATGLFVGLTHSVERGHLAYAVLEGVVMAMCDGADALHEATPAPDVISIIGGGARSEFWSQLLCDGLNLPLEHREGSEVGPALGAAYLARMSIDGPDAARPIPQPNVRTRYEPNADRATMLSERRQAFRRLYEKTFEVE